MPFDDIPILEHLPVSLRQPVASKPLTGGQSLVRLWQLDYGWGSAVLKGPLQAREALFYRDVAPLLVSQGIALPEVYALLDRGNEAWLLREAFPQLLPHKRWFGDGAVLDTLRRIHALPQSFVIPQPFIPTWQGLAEPYVSDLSPAIREQLERLMLRHDALFTPAGVIVGDPNATNWGIRADGTVVLFDWDHVGYGIPAFDVAVVIPGLGWPTLFEQVADAYLAQAVPAHTTDDVMRFAHDMAMAKLQITVEYVNAPEYAEENREYVLGSLPSWIVMLGHMDAAYHARFG